MPRSWSPAGAVWPARTTSPSSRTWPTPSGRPSGRRGRRWTPASTRTPSRSGRPARPSRRTSTSPWASPGPSSTAPACRRPRPSSPLTRTRRRRSSSWPTSASSATCSRSPRPPPSRSRPAGRRTPLPPPLARSRRDPAAGPFQPPGPGKHSLAGAVERKGDRLDDASARLLDRAHRLTTSGLVLLVTFIAFEAMAVGTAMPTAVAQLHGLAWYAWPFSAFLVAQVVGMVVGGDLGDRRGARVALPWGVAAFASGLLTAGLAGDMAVFVAGRAVQGLGGGVISVVLYVVAGSAYEPALRPRLVGAIRAAWVLPALVGPVIAGLLATPASWRWVFLGLLPLIPASLGLVVPPGGGLPATGSGVP